MATDGIDDTSKTLCYSTALVVNLRNNGENNGEKTTVEKTTVRKQRWRKQRWRKQLGENNGVKNIIQLKKEGPFNLQTFKNIKIWCADIIEIKTRLFK